MVRVVRTVDARRRIDPKHRTEPAPTATWFSVYDVWTYVARFDTKVCPVCQAHEETGEFKGNHLRAKFPRLEIMDVLTIEVNAHPNCRCYLERVIQPEVHLYPEIHVGTALPEIAARKKLDKAIKSVPEQHLKKLRAIQVVNLLAIGKDRVAGAYHRPLDLIQIDYDILDSPRGRGVVQHEIGHHVYDDLMTREEKLEWFELWQHSALGDYRQLPSDYARSSDNEGFAEAYAAYIGGLPAKREFEESEMYQFIHKIIKKAKGVE